MLSFLGSSLTRFLSVLPAVAPLLGIALASLLNPSLAEADPYYLRSTVGRPWGNTTNESAMDAVFGAGNWRDERYETVNPATLFSNGDFIFMEGSDDNANEMEAFLTANAAAINTFVSAGGVIFFNAAPNEGNGMNFGFGVSLIYNAPSCSSNCNAVDGAHPIFNGPFLPVGTSFRGSSFSHAIIEGSFTPLIKDLSGNTLLAELAVGGGYAIFGGMTTPNYHSPQPEATNLRRNIIAHGMDLAINRCFAIDAIDDEFSVINDGSTADLLVLENDECNADTPISVVELPGDLQPDRGGSATADGDTVSYTPAAGFVGFEEFTYTAQDAGLEGGDDPPAVDQDTAAVVVNVLENLIPDAVDDVATTLQDQDTIVDVLANDTPGNAPNAVEIETEPANGSATVQPDDTIRYSPNFEFFGEDSFEYRLTDANGDSDVATVTVGVFFVRGQVSIDIMLSDPGNNLNLRAGKGAGIDVVILSVGEFFEAPNLIDPLTLKFGPRGGNIWGGPRVRDVDADGDDDLVVKFLIQQSGIACGDSHATVSGRTFGAQSISGTDAINTFSCPRVRKRH